MPWWSRKRRSTTAAKSSAKKVANDSNTADADNNLAATLVNKVKKEHNVPAKIKAEVNDVKAEVDRANNVDADTDSSTSRCHTGSTSDRLSSSTNQRLGVGASHSSLAPMTPPLSSKERRVLVNAGSERSLASPAVSKEGAGSDDSLASQAPAKDDGPKLKVKLKQKRNPAYVLPSRLVDYFLLFAPRPDQSLEPSSEVQLKHVVLVAQYPEREHPELRVDQDWKMFGFTRPSLDLRCLASTDPRAGVAWQHCCVLTASDKTRTIKLYATFLRLYLRPGAVASGKGPKPAPGSQAVLLPAVMCLISHYPMIQEHSRALKDIYLHGTRNGGFNGLSVESYISHLVSEVPLPSSGCAVRFPMSNCNIVCTLPRTRNPLCSQLPMHMLFDLVSVPVVLAVLRALMGEGCVVLHSTCIQSLMTVAQCMLQLLYPFEWTSTYIPVVPESAIAACGVMGGFFLGVPSTSLPLLDQWDLTLEDCLLVDLDGNSASFLSAQAAYSDPPPPLPPRAALRLHHALSAAIGEYRSQRDRVEYNSVDMGLHKLCSSKLDRAITDSMLRFFQQILHGFRGFVFRLGEDQITQVNLDELVKAVGAASKRAGRTDEDTGTHTLHTALKFAVRHPLLNIPNDPFPHQEGDDDALTKQFLQRFACGSMFSIFLDRDAEYTQVTGKNQQKGKHANLRLYHDFIAAKGLQEQKTLLSRIRQVEEGRGMQLLDIPLPARASHHASSTSTVSITAPSEKWFRKRKGTQAATAAQPALPLLQAQEAEDRVDLAAFSLDTLALAQLEKPAQLIKQQYTLAVQPAVQAFVAYKRVDTGTEMGTPRRASLGGAFGAGELTILRSITQLCRSQDLSEHSFQHLLHFLSFLGHDHAIKVIAQTMAKGRTTQAGAADEGLCVSSSSLVILAHVFAFVLRRCYESSPVDYVSAKLLFDASKFFFCNKGNEAILSFNATTDAARMPMDMVLLELHPFRSANETCFLCWTGILESLVQNWDTAQLHKARETRTTSPRSRRDHLQVQMADLKIEELQKDREQYCFDVILSTLIRMKELGVEFSLVRMVVLESCQAYELTEELSEVIKLTMRNVFKVSFLASDCTGTDMVLDETQDSSGIRALYLQQLEQKAAETRRQAAREALLTGKKHKKPSLPSLEQLDLTDPYVVDYLRVEITRTNALLRNKVFDPARCVLKGYCVYVLNPTETALVAMLKLKPLLGIDIKSEEGGLDNDQGSHRASQVACRTQVRQYNFTVSRTRKTTSKSGMGPSERLAQWGKWLRLIMMVSVVPVEGQHYQDGEQPEHSRQEMSHSSRASVISQSSESVRSPSFALSHHKAASREPPTEQRAPLAPQEEGKGRTKPKGRDYM